MHDLYLVSEVAKKLRVSEMTIYRYIDSGKIKAHRLGKGYRIPEVELASFLQSIKTT